MKKLISILLVITIAAALAACGNKPGEVEELPQNAVADTDKTDIEEAENKPEDEKEPEATADNKKPSAKPSDEQTHYPNNPVENKPTNKPAETKPAENKPTEAKPAENKPAEKPVEKPVENEPAVPLTLGNKLLAEFKAKASMNTEALANALVQSSFIEFSGVAMPIEEGLLTGFGNTEIKGFKSGAVFSPMIGSIPFVGYVFELENASDVSSFISTLKANANLRWNVCTEAEEMVTGSSGNKVFFVMCPTDFDEE